MSKYFFYFYFSVANKSKLYKAGAIEVLLTFASTPILPVTFKLLGALRMLIDGQGKYTFGRHT